MRVADEARAAGAAVAFLTRLPVGRTLELDGADISRGAVWFPAVGGAVGAAVGGIAEGLVHVLPPLAAAGLAILAGTVLTGALHLDALADMADALGSPRERALAIMRDHAIGAYGAAALGLDLIVKAATLASLATHHRAVWVAIAAGTLSRGAAVCLAGVLPPVRTDGAGSAFRVTRSRMAAAVAIAAAIAVGVGRLHGSELLAISATGLLLLAVAFRRWLGGVTGDLLGSTIELTETLTLVAAAALTASR